MSDNKQLRDEIENIANKADVFAYGADSGVQRENFRILRNELVLLGEKMGRRSPPPASPHPDTARLDWLLAQEHGISVGPWLTRDKIDAAMRPAPKYRPWTQDEAHGRIVVSKRVASLDAIQETISATSKTYWWRGGVPTSYEKLLSDYVQPDGRPCGVEVKA